MPKPIIGSEVELEVFVSHTMLLSAAVELMLIKHTTAIINRSRFIVCATADDDVIIMGRSKMSVIIVTYRF